MDELIIIAGLTLGLIIGATIIYLNSLKIED